MHNAMKNFYLNGIVDGKDIITRKERLVKEAEDTMRDEGYVPVVELLPQFTRSMRHDGQFDFELTVYGAYVGEDNSWQIAAMTDGKAIPRTTAKPK